MEKVPLRIRNGDREKLQYIKGGNFRDFEN